MRLLVYATFTGMLATLVLWANSVHAQDAMNRSFWLNTVYCQGVAEGYHDRLDNSGAHNSEARSARRVARALKSRANTLAGRFGFEAAEGAEALSRGTNTIKGMMPVSGSWSSGGDIPIEAVRQYQQCKSIVE